VRTIFLWRDTAYQRLAIQNHGDLPVDLRLTMLFDSDFADLFEVRGLRRTRRGTINRETVRPATAILSYEGLDARLRQTVLHFDPVPGELTATTVSYRLNIAPKEYTPVCCTIGCGAPEPPKPVPLLRGLRAVHRNLRAVSHNAATVETSNDLFNEVLCRSMADLYMLMTKTPQGPYPYAGIPWYSTTFGRDGLITALQMLWLDPRIAKGVLRRLAALQATTDDPPSDAQPGKILHEMREGEMAALREVPFGLYYGTVDATPLFVMLAGLYAERTGDNATVVDLWPAIEAALSWIDGPGDPDGDGFIEYYRATEEGLANQGWKDSQDAIFHADGRLAEGPIALAEVQGYVYCAKLLAARCARRLGRMHDARRLRAEADLLAERFDASFWCPDLGTYALALDGKKEPCRVRSSNAGQVLFTGIARPERAIEVGEGLLRPQFFSGWGIRTIANTEARYNPMSYHNGSIWPHDNALIALGLARYGLKRSVERVFKGLFEAATYMELRRLP
jgi:glycogen debranching enzyme